MRSVSNMPRFVSLPSKGPNNNSGAPCEGGGFGYSFC
jgi:hypothetical protein